MGVGEEEVVREELNNTTARKPVLYKSFNTISGCMTALIRSKEEGEKRNLSSSGLFLNSHCQPAQVKQLPASPLGSYFSYIKCGPYSSRPLLLKNGCNGSIFFLPNHLEIIRRGFENQVFKCLKN
jgi:hypothetical protein